MSLPTDEMSNLSLEGEQSHQRRRQPSQRGQQSASPGRQLSEGSSHPPGSTPDQLSSASSQVAEGPTRRHTAQRQRRANERELLQQNTRNRELQRRRPLLPAQTASNISTPSNTTFTSEHVLGVTGIPYIGATLRDEDRKIAERALSESSPFYVESALSNDSDRFLAFHIKKTENLRIYEEPSSHRPVTCSCDTFESRGTCHHVYWFFDGINDVLAEDKPNSPPQSLETGEIEAKLTGYRDIIHNRLEDLPDMLNFRGYAESESDTDNEDAQDISELVSVLDADQLPEELSSRLAGKLPPFQRSLSQLVMEGDPIATIFSLARHDNIFADRLRNAVTPARQAMSVINKLKQRADGAFQTFEDYKENGGQPSRVRENAVPMTASRLCAVINRLRDSLATYGPTVPDCHIKIAMLAVAVLRGAWNCDNDIYRPRPSWLSEHAATTQAPSQLADRNLFIHLCTQREPPLPMVVLGILDNAYIRPHLEGGKRILKSILEDLDTKYPPQDPPSPAPSGQQVSQVVLFREALRQLVERDPSADIPGVIEPARAARRRPSNLHESASQRRRVG